jgi:hypothetical protein
MIKIDEVFDRQWLVGISNDRETYFFNKIDRKIIQMKPLIGKD